MKDGIHEYIIHGHKNTVNPDMRGTKMAASYLLHIPSGQTQEVHLRLSKGQLLKDPLGKNSRIYWIYVKRKQMSFMRG